VMHGREGATRMVTRAIVASTVGVMTSQVFNSGEYSKQLWLLLGMAVAAASLGSEARLERSPARRGGTTSLVHVPAV